VGGGVRGVEEKRGPEERRNSRDARRACAAAARHASEFASARRDVRRNKRNRRDDARLLIIRCKGKVPGPVRGPRVGESRVRARLAAVPRPFPGVPSNAVRSLALTANP